MKAAFKHYLLLILMLACAGASVAIRPTSRLADMKPAIALANIVPEKFGDWSEIKDGVQQIVLPEELKTLSELYSQTLSKIYVDSHGYQVMLSVAYGGDQSRDLAVHRPEVCYAAHGFQLSNQEKTQLNIGSMSVPVMRMQAELGSRHEPVMYWIRVGDKLVRGNLELGFARLAYGIKGQIADGLLFRVSSIDTDSQTAFSRQEQFVRELNMAMSQAGRAALFGDVAFKPVP